MRDDPKALVDRFLTEAKDAKIAVYMVYGHMTPGQLNIFNVSNVPAVAVHNLKRELLGLGGKGSEIASRALHLQRGACVVCETYCSDVAKKNWSELTETEQGFHTRVADVVIEAVAKNSGE